MEEEKYEDSDVEDRIIEAKSKKQTSKVTFRESPSWETSFKRTFSFTRFRPGSALRRHSIAFTDFEISDTRSSAISSLLILFAIFEGICGFVLPISDAFSKNENDNAGDVEHKYYYESFLMIQYIMAILVLTYLQAFIYYYTRKEEEAQKLLRNIEQQRIMENTKQPTIEFSLGDDEEQVIQQGQEIEVHEETIDYLTEYHGTKKAFTSHTEGVNLYLRLGAVGFGFGVMILDGFKIADRFENEDSEVNCHSQLWIPKHSIHLIYVFWQTYFIFKYHRIAFNRQKFLVRFTLSHMAVTNLCQWIKTVIEEIVEESKHEQIKHMEDLHGKTFLELRNHSHFQECHSVVNNLKPYLIPCAVEYSLISGAIFFKMFQRVGNTRHEEIKLEKKTSGHVKSSNFSECHKSHRGLFVGLLLLIATLVSISLFFLLDAGAKKKNKSLVLYQATELSLLSISLITTIAVLFRFRVLKFNALTEGVAFDDNLLLIGLVGILFYDMFLLVPALEVSSTDGSTAKMFAIKAVLEIMQSTTQVFFIIEGSRRCAGKTIHVINKPGRTLVVLLLITNLAMWVVNIFEVRRASQNIIHSDYFTNAVWTIITHTLLPLIIFFRFHSTVCLSDIWSSAYKFRPD